MKKIILALLITFASVSVAFAHCGMCGMGEEKGSTGHEKGSKTEKMDMKAKMDKMFEGLDLSDEQKEKIKILKETKHKAIKTAKEEFKAGLKEVLSEEQLKIYKGMHEDHKH